MTTTNENEQREHIIDGEFQSDKYPDTPRGLIPFKATDPMAQDLLWEYAKRRRAVDSEFSDDLEWLLKSKGFVPSVPPSPTPAAMKALLAVQSDRSVGHLEATVQDEVAAAVNTAVAPTGDSNVIALIAQFHERSAKGVAEYGVTTDQAGLTFDQWREHAIEEALDFAVYLRAMQAPAPTAALEALNQLVRVKQAADGGTALFSSQGQAMSGIEELYNYRGVIEKYEAALRSDKIEEPPVAADGSNLSGK